MTLTAHVLGLHNFQKVQKERHSFELALQMSQMNHWVLSNLKTVPKGLVLMGHHNFETVHRKHWEHHKDRKEYGHGRKNLHSEHHSCLTVWKALCNSGKKRHLQTFQRCQKPCMSVKEILQRMNRMKKARRNLAKVLQDLHNLLMVATGLRVLHNFGLAFRHRLTQR
jgi:hypothetical protein